jgi:hypothetical protein
VVLEFTKFVPRAETGFDVEVVHSLQGSIDFPVSDLSCQCLEMSGSGPKPYFHISLYASLHRQSISDFILAFSSIQKRESMGITVLLLL